MPAPAAVIKLCETFAEHREHFRSGHYNEFQLRKQFLDPLFELFGWDMATAQGLAPHYRPTRRFDPGPDWPPSHGP